MYPRATRKKRWQLAFDRQRGLVTTGYARSDSRTPGAFFPQTLYPWLATFRSD